MRQELQQRKRKHAGLLRSRGPRSVTSVICGMMVWLVGLCLVFYGGVVGSFRMHHDAVGWVRAVKQEEKNVATIMTQQERGVVILDLLGLLGNNVFEVGFANAMATELGWDILYRPVWNTHFTEPRAQACFPHAFLDNSIHNSKNNKTEAPMLWYHAALLGMIGDQETPGDMEWGTERLHAALSPYGLLEDCAHTECNFTGAGVADTLARLSHPKSTVRVLHLRAFFIHGEWLHPLLFNNNNNKMMTRRQNNPMQEWFAMHQKGPDSCCPTPPPPPGTVVIHIRDFEGEDDNDGANAEVHASRSINMGVYKHILKHYDYMDRPVWIVCQPKTVKKKIVHQLQEWLVSQKQGRQEHVQIHVGVDAYDAFCILTRAPVLIVSYASTFSQAAALIAPDTTTTANSDGEQIQQVVHIPMVDEPDDRPQVTIDIPHWKYHLVDDSPSRNRIQKFDVPHDQFQWRLD